MHDTRDTSLTFPSLRGTTLLLIAIHRLSGLRLDEKLLVSDLCRDRADLETMNSRDIVSCTGRERSGSGWDPSRALALAESDLEFLEHAGIVFVQFDDVLYPPLLRETAVPPFGLFVRGRLPDPDRPSAAIVGTRTPTGRGLAAAFSLCADLARAGVPVISGLAIGIDSRAHTGALSGNGYTLAVLPCGIDRIYPPSNRRLASAILDSGGSLVSEYPPGEGIHKYRFPERNRIIAGLARACVIVEAPAVSGALITAEHAISEGRDVWVHSACAGGPRNAGADKLAAEGAPVLSDASGILSDWGIPCPARSAIFPESSKGTRLPPGQALMRELGFAVGTEPGTPENASVSASASASASAQTPPPLTTHGREASPGR